jgi:hypothetical protein
MVNSQLALKPADALIYFLAGDDFHHFCFIGAFSKRPSSVFFIMSLL